MTRVPRLLRLQHVSYTFFKSTRVSVRFFMLRLNLKGVSFRLVLGSVSSWVSVWAFSF